MDKLTIAIDLLDHGYNIIPTDLSARRPLVAWKKYQQQRVTHDEILQWFRGKDHNIAIVCGQISNVVCVDADSPEAISYWLLTGTATPFRVKTRKGMHFFYRHPGYTVQSKTKAMVDPPIDIKADGGIVTALGTVRDGVFCYQLDEECDLHSGLDLPFYQSRWFYNDSIPIEHIVHRPTMSDSVEGALRYVAKVPGSLHGSRNSDTFKLMKALERRFRLSADQMTEVLSVWNVKSSPPLDMEEIATIVKNSFVS